MPYDVDDEETIEERKGLASEKVAEKIATYINGNDLSGLLEYLRHGKEGYSYRAAEYDREATYANPETGRQEPIQIGTKNEVEFVSALEMSKKSQLSSNVVAYLKHAMDKIRDIVNNPDLNKKGKGLISTTIPEGIDKLRGHMKKLDSYKTSQGDRVSSHHTSHYIDTVIKVADLLDEKANETNKKRDPQIQTLYNDLNNMFNKTSQNTSNKNTR